MTPYNPFTKALDELNGEDLAVLTTVVEGWFIDYKSAAPNIKDLARHLAAFANQHGGWLFLGINEDPTQQTAGTFPGIDTNETSNTLTLLREAASAHTIPPVTFATRIINGPAPSINLPAGRTIIIVNIPESNNTPHLHSTGRIYVRIADHSVPMTDQRTIDALTHRRIQAHEQLNAILTTTPTPSLGKHYARAYAHFSTTLSTTIDTSH